MKLASLDDGSTAGLPVVVSRDLSRCAPATAIVGEISQALLDWERFADRLRAFAARLEAGRGEAWRFHEAQALAPVPEVAAGDGATIPLGAARVPVVASDPSAGVFAEFAIAALADVEGRARLVVPVLRMADGPAGENGRLAAAPVAITPDEIDEVAEPRHPPRASLEALREGERVASERPLAGPLAFPRPAPGRMPPPLLFAGEAACRVQARTGDRMRASLRDARGRPIAGVIELTIDPPAPRMAALGLSRPPLRPQS